jgi:hypothetical protein|tara:strand:- start:22 stop:453 length:432 start_codon:yes stop_codon:yes gene_type:complete
MTERKIMSSFEKAGGATEVEVTADDVAASIDWIEQQLKRRLDGEPVPIARASNCPIAMAVKRTGSCYDVSVSYDTFSELTVRVRTKQDEPSMLYRAGGARSFLDLFDSRRSWNNPSSFIQALERVGLQLPLPVDLTLDEGGSE